MEYKAVVEGGAVSLFSALGGFVGSVVNEPTSGALIAGALALAGVMARCATEVWKIKRRDRDRIRVLKARLEKAGLKTDTDDTEDR